MLSVCFTYTTKHLIRLINAIWLLPLPLFQRGLVFVGVYNALKGWR